ncbi:hypothetical protein AQ616_18385 [Oceanobacillus sp. E9]|uniref:hypothetical protein n=1 Tax=Oceanobacillus sp. E9 TaxID=1742575 RepID=UPI00084E7544|nr:hypothetical protein [Oceanobacillus sp. E9]OEH53008.1 hypothetical protein AQ616_18385 [Oceanobacillus sp. E9]
MEQKIIFGKLLGEIYRIQNRNGYCPVSEGRIYGLLNGIESAIDKEIESSGFLSNEELGKVAYVLDDYWKDPNKMEEVQGYYNLEDDFERAGLSRGQIIKALTYFKANSQFNDLIEKFDSERSPVECKTFELDEWDK